MRFAPALWIAATLLLAAAPSQAEEGLGKIEKGVPSASQKAGTPVTIIDPGFGAVLLAAGTDTLENPSGPIVKFGYLSDGTPTEPDENIFLALDENPGGPDPSFDYGRHFLFQGHEFDRNLAYVTRINLDVPRGDGHGITLLTLVDSITGLTGFNAIDGSAYDPFTKTLLFTEERASETRTGAGRVIQITLGWPPKVTTLEAFLGLGGYEGVHPDDKGNLYMAEDIGGARNSKTEARQPNSFLYRFLPNNPSRIEDGGRLQALQVLIGGNPVVFNASSPDGDIMSEEQLKLYKLGTSYPAKWVTIHTSAEGATAVFDANAAAKAAGATPFKRPENIAWLPGSLFRIFYFSVTGDTHGVAGENPELAARGAWGSIFRVDLGTGDGGQVAIFVLGDREHNSFDNIAFADKNTLLAAEDRGDKLHSQLNALDSIWAFSLGTSDPNQVSPVSLRAANPTAIRFVALGQDATALARGEDNEPTGLVVSNGSLGREALVGTEESLNEAQGFLTVQHGDNNVFRIGRAGESRKAAN
ncbi:MAG: PhoX family protein [Beijerinckiaceae bacterium]|nr:PhoX family protein [Beijerinckiaceae bacterium]MCI0736339.1 PhoX family protein [Beijerinckiaceae bacterium]